MTSLPDDIWHMICTQLRHQRDLNTLFSCACLGRQLAPIALTNLYRMHDVAPIYNDSSKKDIPAHDKIGRKKYALQSKQEKQIFGRKLFPYERYTRKRAGFWRTIILSSLGKTLYPYSQYLRTLNLQDMKNLFNDSGFETIASIDFFQGEIEQFMFDEGVAYHRYHRYNASLDMINKMGEAITKQTPLLEKLIGDVPQNRLSRWIPRLPRLISLNLCNMATIEGNGNLVRLHCPSFKALSLDSWNSRNHSDQVLAAFLDELRPHSLNSFKMTIDSLSSVGPHSFQALSRHGKSLIELKLNMLSPDAIPQVSLLRGCTNLVSLSLGGKTWDYGEDDLEEEHNKAFLKMVAWLKGCKQLQTLAFAHFPSAEALMTSVFLENNSQLTSLEYDCRGHLASEKFLPTLANQTSLEFLSLKEAKGWEEYDPEAADVLLESLSKLVNLTELHVGQISNNFSDFDITQLATSLPKLKVWSTYGFEITDAIWDAVASLKSLRSLELAALTIFTVDGILDFIEKLGPGNKGLFLDVRNSARNFSWRKQDMIDKRISQKVGGEFGFCYKRDFNRDTLTSESDLESEKENHPI